MAQFSVLAAPAMSTVDVEDVSQNTSDQKHVKRPRIKRSKLVDSPFKIKRKKRALGLRGAIFYFAIGLFLSGIFFLADYFTEQFFENWGLWIGMGCILLSGLLFFFNFR